MISNEKKKQIQKVIDGVVFSQSLKLGNFDYYKEKAEELFNKLNEKEKEYWFFYMEDQLKKEKVNCVNVKSKYKKRYPFSIFLFTTLISAGVIIVAYAATPTSFDEDNLKMEQNLIVSKQIETSEVVETIHVSNPVTIKEEAKPNPKEKQWVSLGNYETTAYCGEQYHHICNDGDATQTSTGAIPKTKHTIAVDPKVNKCLF